ncbi:MAG: GNAT family N-acetyltransferase [Acetobacteraceae bacterium]
MSTIRPLDEAEATAHLPDLARLLVDAVAHGASVNFLAGLTAAEATAFWRGQLPGIAAGARRLLVAEAPAGAGLAGCVILSFAPQPNAPHRGEITKMLVHSAHRRQGLGRALLGAAEAAARAAGRSLLLLDTEAGSAGEALYRACGWTWLGAIPDHALRTDGTPSATSLFYKRLA